MPRKRKEQAQNKPARREPSSAADDDAEDLRSIFEKQFAEQGSKVRWCEEQTKDLPASESGPRLNETIIAALAEVRRLIREFVERLRAIGLSKKRVRSEAMKAFPYFHKICASYISDNTWDELQRNVLAEARRSPSPRRPREKPAVKELDVFQRTMKRNPALTFRDICGRIDDEHDSRKRPIPVPQKCLRHGHTTLVQSIDCTSCRPTMKPLLSMKRAPLDLPRPPRSKFPLAGETTKLSKVKS